MVSLAITTIILVILIIATCVHFVLAIKNNNDEMTERIGIIFVLEMVLDTILSLIMAGGVLYYL